MHERSREVEAAVPILTRLRCVAMAISESQARPDAEGGYMDPSFPTRGVHDGWKRLWSSLENVTWITNRETRVQRREVNCPRHEDDSVNI